MNHLLTNACLVSGQDEYHWKEINAKVTIQGNTVIRIKYFVKQFAIHQGTPTFVIEALHLTTNTKALFDYSVLIKETNDYFYAVFFSNH